MADDPYAALIPTKPKDDDPYAALIPKSADVAPATEGGPARITVRPPGAGEGGEPRTTATEAFGRGAAGAGTPPSRAPRDGALPRPRDSRSRGRGSSHPIRPERRRDGLLTRFFHSQTDPAIFFPLPHHSRGLERGGDPIAFFSKDPAHDQRAARPDGVKEPRRRAR